MGLVIGPGSFERSPSVREKMRRVRPEWDLTPGFETALQCSAAGTYYHGWSGRMLQSH